METNRISVNEAAKQLGVSGTFIRKAIELGNFPGSYITGPHGNRTFHIPRTGFEAYCKGLWRKKDNALLNYLEERERNYENTDGRKQ